MEVGVFGIVGVALVDGAFLSADLEVEDGGFESDEAGFPPFDGGEFVDEGLFDVVVGAETGVLPRRYMVSKSFCPSMNVENLSDWSKSN